jgi:hypothetical protein
MKKGRKKVFPEIVSKIEKNHMINPSEKEERSTPGSARKIFITEYNGSKVTQVRFNFIKAIYKSTLT